jgi:uncharacterized membrane protein YcaP (DUF421 family)
MDSVLRATIVYLALLVLFRIVGKRGLAQMTAFDFVLLLVVGEATQQTLLGEDFSLVNAVTVMATLVGLDRFADYIGYRFPKADRLLESVSVLLVDDGKLLEDRLKKAHVDPAEILTSARQAHGLERLDQVKYAVLEKNGGISIVPRAK